MMKRILYAIISLALLCSLLVGCQPAAEEEVAPPVTEKPAPPPVEKKPAPPAEEEEITPPAEEEAPAPTKVLNLHNWDAEYGRLDIVPVTLPGNMSEAKACREGDPKQPHLCPSSNDRRLDNRDLVAIYRHEKPFCWFRQVRWQIDHL